jgi:hypothetical protein
MKVSLIFKVAICNFMESPTCDSLHVATLFACLACFRFASIVASIQTRFEWRYVVRSSAASGIRQIEFVLKEIALLEDSSGTRVTPKIKRNKKQSGRSGFPTEIRFRKFSVSRADA